MIAAVAYSSKSVFTTHMPYSKENFSDADLRVSDLKNLFRGAVVN